MVESITVITLLLSALDRIDLQAIFDRDPYESRGLVILLYTLSQRNRWLELEGR
jgi:hypothetical protein